MKQSEIMAAYEIGPEAIVDLIKAVETEAIKEPYWTKRHHVYCLKCHHDFMSRRTRPRCQCGSTNVINYDEVAPRFKEDYFLSIVQGLERKVDVLGLQLGQYEAASVAAGNPPTGNAVEFVTKPDLSAFVTIDSLTESIVDIERAFNEYDGKILALERRLCVIEGCNQL